MDDAELRDPLDAEIDPDLHDPEEDDLELDPTGKKKKDIIDEEIVSAEDLEEEEDEDEEPFDDVNDM